MHIESYLISHLMSKYYVLVFFLIVSFPDVQGQNTNSEIFWKPIADEVYLQEEGHKIRTEKPVMGVGIYADGCFVIIEKQIYQLRDDRLELQKKAPVDVSRLIGLDGTLWALTGNGIYNYEGKTWVKIDDQVFVDLCMHHGQLHAATKEEIFKLVENKLISIKPEDGYYNSDITMLMEDGTQLHADPVRLGPIDRIASYAGTLHVLRPGKLIQFDGKIVNTDFIDWGQLPSKNTKDLMGMGSRLYISTDRGLAELRGASMKNIQGEDGLPVESTTCLAKGFENDMWIGTDRKSVV